MTPNIRLDKKDITAFCRRNSIQKFGFFGSVLGNNFRKDSDIDVLIEFRAGHSAGLIRLAGLELELSKMFGRRVDLRTPGELSRYFRDDVMSNQEVFYAEG